MDDAAAARLRAAIDRGWQYVVEGEAQRWMRELLTP